MKQVVIVGHGGPEKLQVREAPDPEPKPGEVRIRVRASGINFADILARKGLYPDAPPLPAVVGYEVSGSADAVGRGVDQALIGKDVVALTRFGGYADVVSVPANAGLREAGRCSRTSRLPRFRWRFSPPGSCSSSWDR